MAVTLSDAIKGLRAALLKAQAEGAGAGLRFEMKEATIELTLVASDEFNASGEAGLLDIFKVATGVKNAKEVTHKVSVTLQLAPGKDGKPQPIAGEGSEDEVQRPQRG